MIKDKEILKKPALRETHPKRKVFLPFFRPSIGREEREGVNSVLDSGWVGKGAKTEEFENEVKRYVGCRYAIGTNSCTSALELSLSALGISRKDEVITTPMTFPATANVIVHTGARPVFVDIEKDTLNIDPEKIENAITIKTKAIIPVHFAGYPCRMSEILKIAKKYNLFIIGDAAHAFGSEYINGKIGSLGDLTCFSFHATKNITTGEGGMVTTNNKKLADKIRLLSLHGISLDAWRRFQGKTYKHWETVLPGYKYNMFDIQAAIGLAQLKKMDKFIKIRENYARIYNKAFEDTPEIIIPAIQDQMKHSHHLYVVIFKLEDLTVTRDEIMNILQSNNIGIGVHYRALHLHHFYRKAYGFKKGDFPVAEYVSDRVLSLPLYPKMAKEDVLFVARAVKEIAAKYKKRKIF